VGAIPLGAGLALFATGVDLGMGINNGNKYIKGKVAYDLLSSVFITGRVQAITQVGSVILDGI